MRMTHILRTVAQYVTVIAVVVFTAPVSANLCRDNNISVRDAEEAAHLATHDFSNGIFAGNYRLQSSAASTNSAQPESVRAAVVIASVSVMLILIAQTEATAETVRARTNAVYCTPSTLRAHLTASVRKDSPVITSPWVTVFQQP
jgi:hypothetical protein